MNNYFVTNAVVDLQVGYCNRVAQKFDSCTGFATYNKPGNLGNRFFCNEGSVNALLIVSCHGHVSKSFHCFHVICGVTD